MTIEEMVKRKKELGYSYSRIAELSGLPLATVQKVLGGVTKSPRYETLTALEAVLAPREIPRSTPFSYVKEPPASYHVTKQQGDFTVEDYEALPEDVRAELIDGVLYDMSAPSLIHQALAGAIYAELLGYVRKNHGSCVPFVSPLDVQLDRDNKTMVQPDVIVVCDRSKLLKKRLFGEPDLVIEILSPSTRRKDMMIKLTKYINAGVKEYWMVWPDRKKVICHRIQDDYCPTVYPFDAKVPVGIWNDQFEIDFKEIYQQISFLYDLEDE